MYGVYQVVSIHLVLKMHSVKYLKSFITYYNRIRLEWLVYAVTCIWFPI